MGNAADWSWRLSRQACLSDRGTQLRRGGTGVAERECEHRASVVGKNRRVAGGLRLQKLSERERTVRDGEVGFADTYELQEHADRGTTLVVLTRRVQEPRAPAEGGRALR